MSIESLLKSEQIHESAIIGSDAIVFSPNVVKACEVNYCGQYASCWTCPPGIGNLDEIRSRCLRYKKAFIFTCLYDLGDSFDVDGFDAARKSTMSVLRGICGKLDAAGADYIPLGCGSCDVCAKCTYPQSPCRFPGKAIPAVEACGIDVVWLADKIGLGYNNGANTVTYFCIILF